MVFSSMTFLWLFLPLVFVLSLIIRRPRLQNYLLLIFSLLFYAWGEPVYLFLMLFSILMNWTFGLLIEKSAAHKKLFLVLDIIGNLGLLGYFKYTNFILDTIRRLLPSASVPVTHIALPIGISFFTFQAMSYVIDLYRGRYRAQPYRAVQGHRRSDHEQEADAGEDCERYPEIHLRPRKKGDYFESCRLVCG